MGTGKTITGYARAWPSDYHTITHLLFLRDLWMRHAVVCGGKLYY
jgi:hypothetical protein